jgi:hypothetical protein
MKTNIPTIRSFAYKYGAIYGGITIAFSLMLHIMKLTYSGSKIPEYINYAILFATIVFAIYSFRSANGRLLSVGQAVKLGTGTALIAGVFTVLYLLLFSNVIEPDFVERLGKEVTAKQLIEKMPNLTQDQIQQQIDLQTKFFWVSYPFILIVFIIFGLVISWITGLIARRQ